MGSLAALAAFVAFAATAEAAGTWISGAGFDSSSWVKTYAGSPSFVCQYQGVAGTRPYYWSSECDVAINGTAVRGPGVPEVLQLEEGLAWSSTFPSDAFSVTTTSKTPQKVCRAFRQGATSGAMFVGTVGYVSKKIACTYFVSASKVESNTAFEYLFMLPVESPNWDVNPPSPVVPSSSPTPSVTPTISASSSPAVIGRVEWVNASYHLAGFNVAAELAGIEGRSEIYVCKGYLPQTGEEVIGKWETAWGGCADALIGDVEFIDAEYSILVRSPYLVWSKAQPTNADGSPAADLVLGGVYAGMTQYICRAYHPFYRTGPHPGYFSPNRTFTNDGSMQPACIFSYGGGAVHAADYDLLYLYSQMPTVAVPGANGTVVTVVASYIPTPTVNAGLPSFTPTPTGTPSSSPSAGPVIPGFLQWWSPLASLNGRGSAQVGMEGSAVVSVCRGLNPFSKVDEWIPGKFFSGASWCNIPLGSKEVIASKYEMLRENPWLRWDAGVHVNGTAVVGGSLLGTSLTVCRAKMQDANGVSLIGASDHSGWTDNELYHGHKLCFVPYGGKVLRFASFEVLMMLKSSEAVAFFTPSASYSPSPTNSASASASPSPSSTFANVTATPSPSGSAPQTSSATASATASVSVSGTTGVVVVLVTSSPSAAASSVAAASASASAAAPSASASAAAPSVSPTGSVSASGTRIMTASSSGTVPPSGTRTGTKTPVPTGTPTMMFSASAASTPSSTAQPSKSSSAAGGGSTGGGSSGGGVVDGGNTDSGSGSGGSNTGGGSSSGGGSGNSPTQPSSGPVVAAAAAPTGSFYDGSDAGSLFAAVFAALIVGFAAIGAFVYYKDQKKKSNALAASSASAAGSTATASATPASPGPSAGGAAFSGSSSSSSRNDRVPLTQDARFTYPLPGQPQQQGGAGTGMSV